MNQAAIRTATRNLVNSYSTDSGTVFPTGDVLIDFYIDSALDVVTLDLVEYCPESFLVAENITLVADQNNYTLTQAFVQVWDMQKNVTDRSPWPIDYLNVQDREQYEYVGQTNEEPSGFYMMGDTFYFCPTPASNYTNWAKATVVAKEAATLPSGGPTYIPVIAHRLIPIMAAMMADGVTGASEGQLMGLYNYILERVRGVLGHRIQGQPKVLAGARPWLGSTREPTEYDPNWR